MRQPLPGWNSLIPCQHAGLQRHQMSRCVLICAMVCLLQTVCLVMPNLLRAAEPTATAPRPPSKVEVTDRPEDAGNGLIVQWTLSPDDVPEIESRSVMGYRLERRTQAESEFTVRVDLIGWGESRFEDDTCVPGETYVYRVTALGAVDPSGSATPQSAGVESSAVQGVTQWFRFSRWKVLAILLLFSGAILVSTELARRGGNIFIRRIPALDAMEEAVGRATETGKPILFIPGIMDLNELDTVAGITILSHVARTAAEYDTQLEVPNTRALVMNAARETLQGAALSAGRPDWYDPQKANYVTDEQFAFVAHMVGWMQRNQPAACFYLGKFYAESLLLAEAGNAVGAIQIAGTAETTQLPFFVAACDYTLLGDELFAASAYLSREPAQLGALRGQDLGKGLAAVLVMAGSLWVTVVQFWPV